jgi:hypothetical protein
MRSIPEDDMNAEERAALASLASGEDPGRAVEDRIVRALKDRGLLHTGRPVRNVVWWLGAAAAALVLFGSGLALGEYHGGRRTEERLANARSTDVLDAAMLVQQTGSAYVEAVARLAEISASGQDTAHAQQGREVAVSAMEAAATELHQVAPDDPVAKMLLEAIAAGRGGMPPNTPPTVRRVIY